MRVLAVHRDVIVAVSACWQTTCTLVRSAEEGFVIDSPVLPEELDALPALAQQAGFPVSGLLATHGDWDHLLGRLAFPEASLGTGEPTATRLATDLGAPQRRLREFDDEHYVPGPRALGLTNLQSLPVPGKLAIGAESDSHELELHLAPGHTSDGVAFLAGWAGVLVCGDYLSPVEIPMVSTESGGTVSMYRATLAALRPLVERCETVVPGHGSPLPRDRALAILDADLAYLGALTDRGAAAELPRGARSSTQKRIHERNVAALAAGSDRRR